MDTNLRVPEQLFIDRVRYDIPRFQRRYVWKEEQQWEPLWNDTEQLAESNMDDGQTEPHFMGAIVLQQMQVPSGTLPRRLVVDGQQRLTTLQLLLDAVQEVLQERGHADPAERLADLVENPKASRRGEPDNAFKVWPTVVDREAFRHAMTNDLSVAGHEKSLIVQAHNYFKGQAERWLDRFSGKTGDRDRAAEALEDAVGKKLQLVVIDLGGADNPHVIFGTLNARGTPLLQSDMIKNRILHDANIRVNEESNISPEQQTLWPFDDDWWSQEVGRGFQRRPRIDLYLNHWLTLRSGTVMRAYGEFRAFEKHANLRREKEETIHDVARDMREIGNIYRDVEAEQREDIAKFLERRNVMNVGAVTPLLLWLLSADVPKPVLANCLKALESFLVRRVVCAYSARSYGGFFVDLMAKLDAAPEDDADKILLPYLAEQTAQATKWPDDSELRDNFVTAPLYRWLTRGRLGMVLAGIEEQLRTERVETQEAPPKLHIEHIMPQEWHANWPLPDDNSGEAASHRKHAIHTIGNLTLVNNRLNSALSNAPWDIKRKKLADHSVLFLNKYLVNEGPRVWDETAIEKRARWLCEKAIKVWPHHDDIETAR